MTDKTIVLPQKARIIKRNGKPREVILPIKEYKALQSLVEDVGDSLEIQRAKNEIRTGKDTLVVHREVHKSLRDRSNQGF
jgi:uncharacterized protein YrrD